MGPGNKRESEGGGTNWAALRAEQFPHLGNYTITTAVKM